MGGDDTESTPPFFLFLFLFRDGGETPLTPPFFFFSQPIAVVLVIYVTCVTHVTSQKMPLRPNITVSLNGKRANVEKNSKK